MGLHDSLAFLSIFGGFRFLRSTVYLTYSTVICALFSIRTSHNALRELTRFLACSSVVSTGVTAERDSLGFLAVRDVIDDV